MIEKDRYWISSQGTSWLSANDYNFDINIKVYSVYDDTYFADGDTLVNEVFEADLSEWTVIDEDYDGGSWTQFSVSTDASMVHSGSGGMTVTGNVNGSSDWLITPLLQIPNTSDFSVSFWARSESITMQESFIVKVSDTDAAIENFTASLDDIQNCSASWSKYSYNLDTYKRSNIYVAIQCVTEGVSVLYLDDMVFSANAMDITDSNAHPLSDQFILKQNYPNPFNPATTIACHLPDAADVILTIYNIVGFEVKRWSESRQAGDYSVLWDGTDHSGCQVSPVFTFIGLLQEILPIRRKWYF